MKLKFWTPYLRLIHLCLIQQGWKEIDWTFQDGEIWVKMEKNYG